MTKSTKRLFECLQFQALKSELVEWIGSWIDRPRFVAGVNYRKAVDNGIEIRIKSLAEFPVASNLVLARIQESDVWRVNFYFTEGSDGTENLREDEILQRFDFLLILFGVLNQTGLTQSMIQIKADTEEGIAAIKRFRKVFLKETCASGITYFTDDNKFESFNAKYRSTEGARRLSEQGVLMQQLAGSTPMVARLGKVSADA